MGDLDSATTKQVIGSRRDTIKSLSVVVRDEREPLHKNFKIPSTVVGGCFKFDLRERPQFEM